MKWEEEEESKNEKMSSFIDMLFTNRNNCKNTQHALESEMSNLTMWNRIQNQNLNRFENKDESTN